jgi:intraflagellar transport protein 52
MTYLAIRRCDALQVANTALLQLTLVLLCLQDFPSKALHEDAAGPSGRGQQQLNFMGDVTRVLFSCCKGETHTHKVGFKQLYRRLRSMYRPEKLDSTEDLCLEVLLGPGSSGLNASTTTLGGGTLPTILVLGCPTQPFTANEFDTLRAFLRGGGSLLVCMSEGGERQAGTNLNYLLEELGISANADAVVRTAHYKYLHPKEALISDGVLNRALLSSSSKGCAGASDAAEGMDASAAGADTGGPSSSSCKGLDFVYPFGCTLSVQAPAVPILSSGKISYPMQRPLGAKLPEMCAQHA